MPARATKLKSAKAGSSAKTAVQMPGRIPDSTFAKFYTALKKLTPVEFRRRLVKYGITDKQGNFIQPDLR